LTTRDSDDPDAAFTAADTTTDGFVDLDEYKAKYSTLADAAAPEAIEAEFKKIDTNTDG
jgi:Ca2+-binding EF-hand superfamily protein